MGSGGFFARALRDRQRFRRGALAMLAMALAYNIVAIFLAVLHGIPSPAPFLAIPADRYFVWAAIFYTPALLAGWVLAAAVAQIVARRLGGSGSFEDTLALLGHATALATLPALVPDLVITFVQVAGWMDYAPWYASVHGGGIWFWIVWAYLILYLAAFLVLYPAALRAVHSLSRQRAAVAGTIAFFVYQGFILIFIR